ncbi:MAG: hypothetical protein NC127_08750 [Muribaculum sp.]|nr:hypothetical protein [Muribaculum sp.]
MNDITEIFLHVIRQYGSVDIADAEFKKMIHEDSELREEYREWCRAVGSSEKMGFLDYCDEYLDSQESIYDTLNDYDE